MPKPTATPATATMTTTAASTFIGLIYFEWDGTTSSCGAFYLVKLDHSCNDIAVSYNIATDKLYARNPALSGNRYTGLYLNYYIFVGLIGGMTATTTTTTTTTSGGVSTPAPSQAGMGYTSFYYVITGDGCSWREVGNESAFLILQGTSDLSRSTLPNTIHPS
jgi:hypothetical protein